MYLLQGVGCICLIAYVFYRSYIAVFFLLPLLYFFWKGKKKERIKNQKQKLRLEFREMMNSLIAGLEAGYSVENAFLRSEGDLVMLFGSRSFMVNELGYMKKALRNNRNLEDVLENFALRSHIKDIEDFAQVFRIAKRSGGDLPQIMKSSADMIAEKMEVQRKIDTIISAKKLEQSIMNVVPFAIILYVDFSSPGFFESLYHNVTGILIMTALLAVYLFAYYLAGKIISIKI